MVSSTFVLMVTLTSVLVESTADFPIYFTGPTNAQQPIVRAKHASSPKEWPQTKYKDTELKAITTDRLSSLRAQNILTENVHKKTYYNRVPGLPSSNVKPLPNQPNSQYQRYPNTGPQVSTKVPNVANQHYTYPASKESYIPKPGFHQSPYNPYAVLFRLTPNIPNVKPQQPIIPTISHRQFYIIPIAGLQQSPIIPKAGLRQFPIVPNAGIEEISYTASIPNTLYQQPLNTKSQFSSYNAYPEYQQSPNTKSQQSHHTPQESIPDNTDDISDRIRTDEPSKCTWAIVACCNPGDKTVRQNCFELLGCQGFFMDINPCDPEMVEIAADAALNYYEKAKNTTSTALNRNNI